MPTIDAEPIRLPWQDKSGERRIRWLGVLETSAMRCAGEIIQSDPLATTRYVGWLSVEILATHACADRPFYGDDLEALKQRIEAAAGVLTVALTK